MLKVKQNIDNLDALSDKFSKLLISTDEIKVKNMNFIIKNSICYNTIRKLKDENLLNRYKQCKSVEIAIKNFISLLEKDKIKSNIISVLIDDYLLHLVPAGTKGVIRGNEFNLIVKKYIIELQLDPLKFSVYFEKKCPLYYTDEIPDWYILNKSNNKIIIGMNQIDIWNGGQQLNRGSKYLIDNKHTTDKSKLLCVICNNIIFKSNKNKIFKLFEIGINNDTLCYINGIEDIVLKYFT